MRSSTRSGFCVSLAALLGSVAAHGAPLYCVGSVSQVFSRINGELSFKAGYRGDYVAVCNLLSAWNGVQPELCKNWYATLLAAQISSLPVTVNYTNSEGYASCSAIATYGSAPTPGYVLLGDANQ